jgi:hypothetical protein
MARILINLDEPTKVWLTQQAKAGRGSIDETIQRAVDRLRAEQERTHALAHGLQRTAGVKKHADGLDRQNHLRDEWEGR